MKRFLTVLVAVSFMAGSVRADVSKTFLTAGVLSLGAGFWSGKVGVDHDSSTNKAVGIGLAGLGLTSLILGTMFYAEVNKESVKVSAAWRF